MVRKRDDFTPAIAIPPGETLKENLEYLHMTQNELARRTGLSPKHINEIIKGKSAITEETALKLEYVLGIPASFWNNLESNYQETLVRLKDDKELEEEYEIAKEIPYSDMSKYCWIENTKDRKARVKNLRSFFGVSSLKHVPLVISGAFRKADGPNTSSFALAAWLRRGILLGNRIKTEPYNKQSLKKLIPHFRELTMKDPDEFYPKMVELCASCGIALVLVQHLPKTYACGATQWINADKAVIQLSVRGARADIFWFTFFHEIAHIILHNKKGLHLQESNENKCDEDEADERARNWLIPPSVYEDFIESGVYYNRSSIISFSEKIGVHPCIVVGRLMHDKKIEYTHFNDLRPSFNISNN